MVLDILIFAVLGVFVLSLLVNFARGVIRIASATFGNVEAQFNLAARYHNGDGVSKDLKAAVYWCKAAEQGDARAQEALRKLKLKL